MTTDAHVKTAPVVITGTGPFVIADTYVDAAEIAAGVMSGVNFTPLQNGVDFTVNNAPGPTGGTLTLNSQVAADYEDATLHIWRAGPVEQPWSGAGAREGAIEAQLDWLTRAVQNLQRDAARTVRFMQDVDPIGAEPSHNIGFDAAGKLIGRPDAVVSTDLAATYAAQAEAAAATMRKSLFFYRKSNADYTSLVPAGGVENYVQHSDAFTITPTLPTSEIIVISSTETRITNMDGDDDFRAYVQIRYKDNAGVWQTNEATDNHNSAPLGMINVDGNDVMATTRIFSTMFPAMARLGAAEKNAAGDWEIAIFGSPLSDANSEIELHTSGTGFTIIEVEGGTS